MHASLNADLYPLPNLAGRGIPQEILAMDWPDKEFGYCPPRSLYIRVARSKGRHTGKQWAKLKDSYGSRCACCGKKKPLAKDHIMPISRGGSDSIENIQPLCHKCNTKKNAKHIKYDCLTHPPIPHHSPDDIP